ncbi:MAG: cyclodeaminase/cyclohydrolase family protein [Peptostreptococcaceae bacterium]|nr:cyclodeaminase/cyclohydrolase family protein [Peptostreptococcaceae bacterium]
MKITEKKCDEFIEILASKSPAPGGGGASALVAAIGVALGNMVGSLTIGKKKYIEVEKEIVALKIKSNRLQNELLELVDLDAAVFEPLSKAYGLPKETVEDKQAKSVIMEEALKNASSVPLEIMRKSCEAILIQAEFAAKGSAIALSDAGVGVIFCKAALQGASLNVYINTEAMQDRAYAENINNETDGMVEQYCKLADETFEYVLNRIREK